MMYNGYLSIVRFVLLTAKIKPKYLFSLLLSLKYWLDFERT